MKSYQKGTMKYNIKDLSMKPYSKVILVDQHLLELIIPTKFIKDHTFTKHRLKGLLKFNPYLINYTSDDSKQSWIYVNTGIRYTDESKDRSNSSRLRLCYYGTTENIEQEMGTKILFNHTD